jgi:hypothetical protein
MTVLARTMLGFGKKQIEGLGGIQNRIRARVASILSRQLRARLPREFQPNGHTVIAVYTR